MAGSPVCVVDNQWRYDVRLKTTCPARIILSVINTHRTIRTKYVYKKRNFVTTVIGIFIN
jgi:hypothetical protein